MSARNVTKKTTIDTISWTALTPGIACRAVSVKTDDGSSFKLRTTDSDANTEDTIPAGSQEVIETAGEGTRFSGTDTVWYAQAAAGTPKAVIKAVY